MNSRFCLWVGAAVALVTAVAVSVEAQQARPPQPGTTLSVEGT